MKYKLGAKAALTLSTGYGLRTKSTSPSDPSLATASSIASGMPSSRRQIDATSGRESLVNAKSAVWV
jgi:hypothetical protein